ncbi:MAG: heme lyase CcmF/NrfE family subunit, partial [Myxococcota bacterium]
MHELGQLALLVALPVAALGGTAGLLGRLRGKKRLVEAGLLCATAVAALLTVSAGCLLYLLLAGDLSVKYVFLHTESTMPAAYLISAFWGGQEGSLLFWAWVLSMYAAVALRLHRERR